MHLVQGLSYSEQKRHAVVNGLFTLELASHRCSMTQHPLTGIGLGQRGKRTKKKKGRGGQRARHWGPWLGRQKRNRLWCYIQDRMSCAKSFEVKCTDTGLAMCSHSPSLSLSLSLVMIKRGVPISHAHPSEEAPLQGCCHAGASAVRVRSAQELGSNGMSQPPRPGQCSAAPTRRTGTNGSSPVRRA